MNFTAFEISSPSRKGNDGNISINSWSSTFYAIVSNRLFELCSFVFESIV